jgi:uncharacterized protein YndB with AHSA1/START domain
LKENIVKKIILSLLAIVVLAIAGILVAAGLQPSDYHVERSITIDAPREQVYALITDFERYGEWSPWEKLDPAMKKNVSGKPGEVGTRYAWEGNDQAGQGTMTVTAAQPPDRVDLTIEFIKPFQAQNQVSWRLAPEGESTQMTWSMDGKNEGLVPKLFAMLMNMENMLGNDFDEGLENLKGVCEARGSGK